ncbi:GH25 family lysozyme [Pseudofrankia asymbiotica]|uniref:GH25 family lysozyme n=1 Tax=Pseudofrankia asymbiotica TaxID=1834516 RepID=UPI0009D7033B|nr:GH25 family lysozyme [Pseudofrankia asymbiotica]
MRLTHHPGMHHQDRQATGVADGAADDLPPGSGLSWSKGVDGGPRGVRVPAGTPLPPGTTFGDPRRIGDHRSTPSRALPPAQPPVGGQRVADGRPGREQNSAGAAARVTPTRAGTPPRTRPAGGRGSRAAERGSTGQFAPRMALLAVTALALSTTATAAAAAPSPAWPRGVDVSSWQHQNGASIDWNAVKAAGNSFAVVKATEGTTYVNPHYAADRAGAQAAGLVIGSYHYARPALPISTAVDQARHFLATIGNVNAPGMLAPVLDLETTGGLNPTDLTAWTQAFLHEVESQTGRTPILYTFRSFWTDKIANTPSFAKYPLWFAIYNSNADPGWLPGGWQKWLIWQYDSSGAVSGIPGKADVNAFCCSAADLASSADGTRDEIAARYAAEPLLHISLGAPARAEGPAGGGGRWQPYANGLMFWSVETGARALFGPIAQKYLAYGGSNGSLRRPLEDISWTTAPDGLQAVFEGGWIYWHPALGAFVVHGEILNKYLALGGSASWLGMPTSDEYDVPGGRESAFQNGKLRWTAATNQVTEIHNTPVAAPAP